MKNRLSKLGTAPLALLLALLCCIGLLPTTAMAEETYSVVSPVGYSTIEQITQAPRLDTLAGKTIAIVGRSFNATVTQSVLKECILEDYPDATVYTVNEAGCGGVFSVFHQSAQSRQFQKTLQELGVDAVISGNCGCGLCTVKESGSSIAAEYIGIPTVTVGASSFISEIHSTGVNRGVPVLRTAEYPGAFSADSQTELRRKSREIIYPLVVEALTTPITDAEVSQHANEGYRAYDDVLVSGPDDMIQEYFKQCGYTDGLPINLPTKEKVEEYLRYTPYDGSEVLGVYPLAYRECRVYTVAVNAIMAGCPAEYMPLCVAFTKCLGDGEWRRTLASTHGWSPYAWINGPVARQLGIDCGQGMISETANKSLARFIELAMMNLGGYYIKENRMGTFGYMEPWVFSEDEAACLRIGWEPYHVTRGYDLNDNTLTASSALAWGNNITPATPDAEQIMTLMAWDITEKEQNGLGNTNPQVWRTVFITEAVANNLAAKYDTKAELEDALVENARRPLWMRVYANYWANTGSYQYTRRTIQEHYDMLLSDDAEKASVTPIPAWLQPLFPNDTEMVTVATMLKDQTPLLVCGDPDRNKVQVMPGGGYATIEIELPRNWDELMEAKGYAPLSSFYLEEQPVLTGPIEVPAELTDGTYRVLPAETQLTAQGRFYYDAVTGVLKYWACGADAAAELTLSTSGDFAQILKNIGTSCNITIENHLITDFIIRPPTTARTTVVDTSELTAAAFTGAGLTLAVNPVQNSQAGGATPDGSSIVMDYSVTDFALDLGGALFLDGGSADGFLTFDNGKCHLDTSMEPGTSCKVGTPVDGQEGVYRTFTITMGKGDYTLLYTASDTMSDPAALEGEPEPCQHDYQWVIDTPATCTADGVKHEECTLCHDAKEPVAIEKTGHSFGEWADGGDGTHSRSCVACGETEQEACTYDEETHVCTVCGAAEPGLPDGPETPNLNVTVSVTSQPSGRTRKIYTADIAVSGSGAEQAKVEYSPTGKRWTEGSTYTSYKEIQKLYVRITDAGGVVTNWYYENGTTTQR